MKTSFVMYALFMGIKITWLPAADLSMWLFFFMLFDFGTGYYKAYKIGDQRTSSGIRKTVDKVIQYVGAVVLVTLFQNVKDLGEYGTYLDDGVIVFLLLTETVSILENLIAISPDSPVTKYLFKRLHALLTIAISKRGEGFATVRKKQQEAE